MTGSTTVQRLGIGLASVAALLAAAPAGAAGADEQVTVPTTVELVSGVGTTWQHDAHTELSRDGGVTWEQAYVVPAHPNWHTIPGTGWVSTRYRGADRSDLVTPFRRVFDLYGIDGDQGTVRVCLYADNAAAVSLNGIPLGAQPVGDHEANYRGGETCFDYEGPLPAGENVLEFTVHDVGDYMGLDYRAVVTYEELPNEAPVLRVPDDVVADAVGPDGAPVTFEVPATDDRGPVEAVCVPPSGTTFPIGTTTVECVAVDGHGAATTGTFDVTVRGAAAQLDDLLAAVAGVGPGSSLAAKIRAALQDPSAACGPLQAVVHEVQAQSGKRIPAENAALLIEDAARISAVLDCR